MKRCLLTMLGCWIGLCHIASAESFESFEAGRERDVPAPYLYNPLAGKAAENASSANLTTRYTVQTVDGSFTFEAFLKPSSIPKKSVPILCAGLDSEPGMRCNAGLRWLSNFRQCYWGGAVWPQVGEKPDRFSTGHYVSISRLTEKTMGWRHLAMVYDAKSQTLSVWLDHFQQVKQRLNQPLPAGLSLWVDPAFDGLVDSVRVVDRPLGVESFLRATHMKIDNVSFDHPERTFPKDAGHLSVKRNFGAVGDGVVDDTLAIRKAFHDLANHQASGATYVLHFPAGTYRVTDTVKWSRFLRVHGEGSEVTKIVLDNRCKGFDDPENPKPVVAASAVPGRPGSNRAVNGSTIANFFHGFTVATGTGNPGAIGVEYHSNNYGSLEDVTIESGDGAGVIGLDLSHKTNGPTLIADTRVVGFETGIKTSHMEYSITMEDVRLEAQGKVGIANGGNILALNRISSVNRVPAIRSSGGSELITILNSTFTGGAAQNAAIEVGAGVYARDVKVSGYGNSLAQTIQSWNPHRKPNYLSENGAMLVGTIDEFVGDKPIHPDGDEVKALALPIKDPPITVRGDLENDWVNVQKFSHLVTGDGKS
ncbi:MAG: glycosyl hydrolase family 28-related protein [Planctomycetota bacterium]